MANQTTVGWVIFIAALGAMGGLVGVDMVRLQSWDAAQTPAFVGTTLIHLSTVIAAFLGGKLIPVERDTAMRTRTDDPQPQPKEKP